MSMNYSSPTLITFDGEARSGKGTIVQKTKDHLRDVCGQSVMLIDRGQAFRVLVVAALRAGVDLDQPAQIDEFLVEPQNIADCLRLVKNVYHMEKNERDGLIYTNKVGEHSAKIGARPLSQAFVADLTKTWLHDAGSEGYDVVLIDGRALEHIATEMDAEGLCQYRMGLYFVCEPRVGARRTLGVADRSYDQLTDAQQEEVTALVAQIQERNKRDKEREVERLIPPTDAKTYQLPDVPHRLPDDVRPMYIIDTSAELGKSEMSLLVAQLCAKIL